MTVATSRSSGAGLTPLNDRFILPAPLSQKSPALYNKIGVLINCVKVGKNVTTSRSSGAGLRPFHVFRWARMWPLPVVVEQD